MNTSGGGRPWLGSGPRDTTGQTRTLAPQEPMPQQAGPVDRASSPEAWWCGDQTPRAAKGAGFGVARPVEMLDATLASV